MLESIAKARAAVVLNRHTMHKCHGVFCPAEPYIEPLHFQASDANASMQPIVLEAIRNAAKKQIAG